MNNAFSGVNTYSMADFPWKMLLRGLEFDLITLHSLSLTQSRGLFTSGGHQTDQQLIFLLLAFCLN